MWACVWVGVGFVEHWGVALFACGFGWVCTRGFANLADEGGERETVARELGILVLLSPLLAGTLWLSFRFTDPTGWWAGLLMLGGIALVVSAYGWLRRPACEPEVWFVLWLTLRLGCGLAYGLKGFMEMGD